MKILFMALFMLLTACASLPMDTNEKKLAAAEITWKQTLLAVDKSVDRMSDSQKSSVKQTLIDTNSAIKSARVALAISNEIAFTDNITIVNSSIDILRTLLEQMEDTGAENVYSFERYNYS